MARTQVRRGRGALALEPPLAVAAGARARLARLGAPARAGPRLAPAALGHVLPQLASGARLRPVGSLTGASPLAHLASPLASGAPLRHRLPSSLVAGAPPSSVQTAPRPIGSLMLPRSPPGRPLSPSARSCLLIFPLGRDEPVPAGQIAVIARSLPAVLLGEHPVDGRALRRAVLHGDQAPAAEQAAGGALDHPDRVQPVLARPQRGGRVVLADLWGHPGPGRDV